MHTNRTTASGERFTLITNIGGRPVSRKAADTYCRTQSTNGKRRKAS